MHRDFFFSLLCVAPLSSLLIIKSNSVSVIKDPCPMRVRLDNSPFRFLSPLSTLLLLYFFRKRFSLCLLFITFWNSCSRNVMGAENFTFHYCYLYGEFCCFSLCHVWSKCEQRVKIYKESKLSIYIYIIIWQIT